VNNAFIKSTNFVSDARTIGTIRLANAHFWLQTAFTMRKSAFVLMDAPSNVYEAPLHTE
jgi:hypothetical protein